MQFALDERGNRTAIDDADKKNKYFCPCCHSEMVVRKGNIKVHHFAHKANGMCIGYYDNVGEWHRSMQELFPAENREQFNGEFGKHFYDVLTDKNTIIEFQHSPMAKPLFDERTDAYVSFARKYRTEQPVWVFDFADEKKPRYFYIYAKDSRTRERRIKWYYSTRLFTGYDDEVYPYELWFRINPLQFEPITKRGFDGTMRVKFDEARVGVGYIKVERIIKDKYIHGLVYSEEDFYKYLLENK